MLESTATPASTDSPSGENIGFVIFISIVATIGGFLFGFDSGVI
ncbi:MAG: sugar porter family MFS transporter, partial [bacterium]|nr:sugar porter family MFS transporter [bacterium]